MILVDTSVWVDHLNHSEIALSALLRARQCPLHDMVMGEIALGNLPEWSAKVAWLRDLRRAEPVDHLSLIASVDQLKLQGSGLGFVDAHLLAWTVVQPGRRLWTRDRRLREQAEKAGVAFLPPD